MAGSEALLRNVDLFKDLSAEDFEHVSRIAVETEADTGSVIIRQGDPADAFYVIGSGGVRIVTGARPDGTGGREIALLEDGDFFGEMGVLQDSPRCASVIAARPTRLVQIKKPDFDGLMSSNAKIATKIMVTLTRRFQRELKQPRPEDSAGEATAAQGRILVVSSMTGGAGTTTVVTNLGVEIARASRKKVVLVDGSLQFGDLPLFVDTVPSLTLFQLTEEAEITAELLGRGYIHKTNYGVHLLAGPRRPEQSESITTDLVKGVLGQLRKSHDYILVDTTNSMQEPTPSILELADEIYYVMPSDIPALKNAGLWLDLLKAMQFDLDKVRLVINKYPREPMVPYKAIEDKIKLVPVVVLPERSDQATTCVNKGVPVCIENSSDPLSVKYAELARRIVSPETVGAEEHGWFKKMLGNWGLAAG